MNKKEIRKSFTRKVHLAAMSPVWCRHDEWLNMAEDVLGAKEYGKLYDAAEASILGTAPATGESPDPLGASQPCPEA